MLCNHESRPPGVDDVTDITDWTSQNLFPLFEESDRVGSVSDGVKPLSDALKGSSQSAITSLRLKTSLQYIAEKATV